jgi:hypothetical protein
MLYQYGTSINGNKMIIVFSRLYPTQSFFTTNVMQKINHHWKSSTHYLPESTPNGKIIDTIEEFKQCNAYWLGKEVKNPNRSYSPYQYQEECLLFSWLKNKKKWRHNKRLWAKFSKRSSIYLRQK